VSHIHLSARKSKRGSAKRSSELALFVDGLESYSVEFNAQEFAGVQYLEKLLPRIPEMATESLVEAVSHIRSLSGARESVVPAAMRVLDERFAGAESVEQLSIRSSE